MILYPGSPQDLKVLKPQLAVGETDFENQKESFSQTVLFRLRFTLLENP